MDRRACYFVLWFTIIALLVWQQSDFLRNVLLKKVVYYVYCIVIVLSVVHFLRCANVSYFYMCPYDASTKAMMRDLKQMNLDKNLKERSQTMGVHWLLEPSVIFYTFKYQLNWLQWVSRYENPDGKYDYYYLISKDAADVKKFGLMDGDLIVNNHDLKIVKRYSVSKTFLAVPSQNFTLSAQ